MQFKNIAIIAHVDHGKTTLVDAMLKQTHTFRDNQKEMTETLIMDSGELEREKGITILAKNTAVMYKDFKINIIDTPGHADFGGEVERTLNMASGALLLVDAAEGPLPQTKFVLKKAIETGLKPIVVINKIDRKDARVAQVLRDIETLFLELAQTDEHLQFTTLYAVGRDGKVFYDLPQNYTTDIPGDLTPLFETILKEIPNSDINEDKPFQMLISTLDYDNFVGKIAIGKVTQGKLKIGQNVSLVDENKTLGTYKVQKLYTSVGITKQEVFEVISGDIIGIAGISDLNIGLTVTDPSNPVSLPKIHVEDPTIKITIGPNTSPLSGKEGKFISSNQIKDRLLKEKETNLGLRIEQDPSSSNFIVSGRGELHLSVLLEKMRREGFEMEVSKPQVIYKGNTEPYEEITIDVPSEYIGIITEEMAKRKAQMINMQNLSGITRFTFKISSQNLLGIRNSLLTRSKGTAILNTYFLGYFEKGPKVENKRAGTLVAVETGKSLSFGLGNSQERGQLFIGPGEDVYEGMVVGLGNRDMDIDVNVCKAKKQTNVRSETADIAIQLIPPQRLSLEQALDFIADDELLEITPKNLRIRKKELNQVRRRVLARKDEQSQRAKNI